jgi:hypothetical protein
MANGTQRRLSRRDSTRASLQTLRSPRKEEAGGKEGAMGRRASPSLTAFCLPSAAWGMHNGKISWVTERRILGLPRQESRVVRLVQPP